MPNHITNIVRISGEGAGKVFKKIKGKKDEKGREVYIDFNNIVTMPKGLDGTISGNEEWTAQAIIKEFAQKCGDDSPQAILAYIKKNVEILMDLSPDIVNYINLYLQYGSTSWYDWSIVNWGTKWNAYSQEMDDDVLRFDTAWATPEPVFAELSRQFPKVLIEVQYADEDIGSNCGRYTYKGGELVEEYRPEGKEATDFALHIKGYDPDDWYEEQNEE